MSDQPPEKPAGGLVLSHIWRSADESAAEEAREVSRSARRSRRLRSPLGASPGTLIAHPTALPTRITVTAINPEGSRVFEDVKPEDIERLKSKWRTLWVDCVGLGDIAAIEGVGRLFGLHQLALEDVVNVGQRPKADFFEHHVYVVLKMIEARPGTVPEQVSLFFGDGFVVTFQERPGDAFDPVRHRIAAKRPRLLNRGADYLAYALIDAIVDAYFPVVDQAGDAIDTVEEEMLHEPRKRQSAYLHRLRREMISLKRWLWPVRDAVAGLIRSEAGYIGAETKLYFNDTMDHVVRMIEIVETYRDTLSGLIDMHLALMQARTSDVINILTIVSTIFIPLTFLVGIWGMNFDPDASPWNMPELRMYYGYPIALAAMAAIAVLLLAYFRWKKWL